MSAVVARLSRRHRAAERTWPPAVAALLRSLRYGRMRIGLAITSVVLLVAALGPAVAPHSQSEFVGRPFTGPTAEAWLGTDYLGQDVLSRLLCGGRSVVWMALAATILGLVAGVTVGLVAGYARNLWDDLLMGATDMVLAFPSLILPILFVSILGPQAWLIVLMVAVIHAPRIARLTRAVTVETVNREFIEVAEVLGVARRRILFQEVLPNLTTPLMVEFGIRLTWSIGIVASISFLGFGIQPPAADWGLMISQNKVGLTIQALATVAPVVMIALFTIGTNLMTDGLARAVSGVDRGTGGR